MSKLFSIPDSIQKLRLSNGLSMRALAKVAGVNAATVCLMEQSIRAVQPKTAKAISTALQCDITMLFSITHSAKEASQ